ncbi:MAG: ATP synthase F1 subunit gamma [Ktedonobacteraceae bacterium]|nr:ATP synthase F1 subunit gamma [Ktedonobacteraceae bacterium]
MPSLRDIRRRIRTTKNMAQITKAKQMVASSKMRRAQERVQQARPFAEQIRDLVSRLADASLGEVSTGTELLAKRPIHNIGFIVITPDRGLCGALPSNINRKAMSSALDLQRQVAEQGERPNLAFIAVGRKGRDFIVRTQQSLIGEFINYGDKPSLANARAIARVAVDAFVKAEVDAVYLVYAKFINTVSQQPISVQLLPVEPPAQEKNEDRKKSVDYIYEPDPATIFTALLPRYVDILVYQAMLEAVASEQSASMVAMKNATDNANELIQDLTLTYNKARQQAITTQILEVVSGAGGGA